QVITLNSRLIRHQLLQIDHQTGSVPSIDHRNTMGVTLPQLMMLGSQGACDTRQIQRDPGRLLNGVAFWLGRRIVKRQSDLCTISRQRRETDVRQPCLIRIHLSHTKPKTHNYYTGSFYPKLRHRPYPNTLRKTALDLHHTHPELRVSALPGPMNAAVQPNRRAHSERSQPDRSALLLWQPPFRGFYPYTAQRVLDARHQHYR